MRRMRRATGTCRAVAHRRRRQHDRRGTNDSDRPGDGPKLLRTRWRLCGGVVRAVSAGRLGGQRGGAPFRRESRARARGSMPGTDAPACRRAQAIAAAGAAAPSALRSRPRLRTASRSLRGLPDRLLRPRPRTLLRFQEPLQQVRLRGCDPDFDWLFPRVHAVTPSIGVTCCRPLPRYRQRGAPLHRAAEPLKIQDSRPVETAGAFFRAAQIELHKLKRIDNGGIRRLRIRFGDPFWVCRGASARAQAPWRNHPRSPRPSRTRVDRELVSTRSRRAVPGRARAAAPGVTPVAASCS